MTATPVVHPELADALDVCEKRGLHIRDVGALASAIDGPAQVVWGEEAYVGVHAKGAALLDAVNRSHPLVDGNKRLPVVLVMLLYRINGLDLVIGLKKGTTSSASWRGTCIRSWSRSRRGSRTGRSHSPRCDVAGRDPPQQTCRSGGRAHPRVRRDGGWVARVSRSSSPCCRPTAAWWTAASPRART